MTDSRNPELEAAILEAPESADAYLVYGDWLLEHGDPLGELVTVQATLAKLRTRAGRAKEKGALERREKLLLNEAEARLGELAAYEHTWSFGFLESLIVPNPSATRYEALLAAPAARFLRELDIEDVPRVSSLVGTHPTLALLTRYGVGPALRKLAVLSDDPDSRLGPIPSELWPKLAAIHELTIRGGPLEPGHIVLPQLETLALAVPLTNPLLDALLQANCPRLASVQLEAPAVAAGRLASLFVTWAALGTLRHLGLTEHDEGDDLVGRLLATRIVQQLTSLDLSRSSLSDRGGRTILENASSFDGLESLNLSENELSEEMSAALEKRFELVVDLEDQGARHDITEE